MSDDAKDYVQKFQHYVHTVESIYIELVNALKQSIRLLEQFVDSVPDPVGWKGMVDDFCNVLETAVRTENNHTIH